MKIRDLLSTVENVVTEDSQWDKFYIIFQEWQDT